MLVAGYFRIRIPSLSDFDKILGGISWGIICSGFDIDLDLEYSDEFRIKEKIKLAERVVKGLKNMGCPHPLLPHQIQGLDFGAIYPVIKWLLQFVIETRQQRQDENISISSEIGRKIVGLPNGTFHSPVQPLQKPATKNKKVKEFELIDPIRVYSSMAEYGNKKAASVYQKMIIERSQIEGKAKEAKDKNQSDKKKTDTTPQKMIPIKGDGSSSKQKEKEEEMEVANLEGFEERPRLARRNSISADDFMELLEENREENEKVAEKIKEIEEKASESGGMFAQETALFNEQKLTLLAEAEKAKEKIEVFNKNMETMNKQKSKIMQVVNQLRKEADELQGALDSITSSINEKQARMKSSDVNRLEQLVQKQIEMKERKAELKRTAKEEKNRIESETEKIESRLGEISQHEDIIEILETYEDRKNIFATKQEELAQISKDTALLMRKIQEYPNHIEISQYTKRYVDLVDKIAKELESQKQLDLMNNGRVDIERMSNDQASLLKNLKTNLADVKKDKQRLDLATSVEEVCKATGQNLERSKAAYKKAQAENESLLTELDAQLTLQRDYYQLLQKIQLEFEK